MRRPTNNALELSQRRQRRTRTRGNENVAASIHHQYWMFVFAILFLAAWSWRQLIQLTNSTEALDQYAATSNALPNIREGDNVRRSKHRIAYVISISEWNSKSDLGRGFLDGTAVLKHSIDVVTAKSKYTDYDMVALVHADAINCIPILKKLNYTVLVRDTPINVTSVTDPVTNETMLYTEIRNKEYAKRLVASNSGCCGAREFLKLYSWTLTNYSVVVHLDVDVMLLKPLDPIFDVMTLTSDTIKEVQYNERDLIARNLTMWDDALTRQALRNPQHISCMFTRDYPMGRYGLNINQFGVQGGFLVVRPNLTVYNEMLEVIRIGSFVPGGGWVYNDTYSFSGFYGAPQVQGLLQYYYGAFYPQHYVELNSCRVNQMVSSPYDEKGQCLTRQEPCHDCRETDVSDIYSVHFTSFCYKPWWCYRYGVLNYNETAATTTTVKTTTIGNPIPLPIEPVYSRNRAKLCSALHHKWYGLRHDLEVEWGVRRESMQVKDIRNFEQRSFGYCKPDPDQVIYHDKNEIDHRYVSMQLPP